MRILKTTASTMLQYPHFWANLEERMHEFYAQENFANSMREPSSGVSSEILTVARHVDFRLIQMSKKKY